MTLPPPPDSYGQQPPPGGGQPGGAVPPQWGQQGGPPQGFGGYGPPPQGQWAPQQQWPGGPGGQPPKGGKGKWILGGIAVALAIALAVVITVLVVRPSGGGSGDEPAAPNDTSEFASAKDDGPVNIVTEDPTCAAWSRAGREYADAARGVNWLDRDKTVPAEAWTPEQQRMYDTVGAAMTRAAERSIVLAKQTPHRVMRELYQQFAAYVQVFTAKIPTYAPRDNDVADVSDALGNSLNNICAAIDFRSAQPIAPLVKQSGPPPVGLSSDDTARSTMFLENSISACKDWGNSSDNFSTATAEWRAIDPRVPASEWTADQRRVNDEVAAVMSSNADELEKIGNRSGNAIFADFAILAAQYRRGLVAALPTYRASDNYLSEAAVFLVQTLNFACKVVS